MRQPLIAGNWKMNTTLSEAVQLAGEIRREIDEINGVDKVICPPFISLATKVICPPFISLATVRELIRESSIRLGAQNLYFEEKGAYTGEISPVMLADLCDFVIIGHSERRQYFLETGELINEKVRVALKFGLKPILCVGERLEENEAGRAKAVIAEQLDSALAGIDYPRDLVIAYEPVWAIGTGRAAIGQQSNETIGFIRSHTAKLYDDAFARNIPILYGGSVTADNIVEFIQQDEIDGALVGGASLKSDQFSSIVRQTAGIR
jgi:triosephosphate isomerase